MPPEEGDQAMLVLVVEDEPVARMTHLALLAKLREVSAVGASTVAEARALIAESPPQLVVLDMHLPDGTGLDVVSALEANKAQAVLVIVSAHLDEYRSALRPSDRIHLLEKPPPMRELQRIVEMVQRTTQPAGPFSVLDYLQLACMAAYSAVIECVTPTGRGEIIIEKGQPWAAQDERGSGVPAFNRLVMSTGRHVRVLPERRWRGPRNLDDRWEHLVLEAMRELDENKPRSAPDPLSEAARTPPVEVPAPKPPAQPAGSSPPAPRAEPPAAADPAEFEACIERALRAVVAKDIGLAIREFEAAQRIRPDDTLVRSRLDRLLKVRAQRDA